MRRSATSLASVPFLRRGAELSFARQTAQLGTLDIKSCQVVGGQAGALKLMPGARVSKIRCLDAAMPFDSEFKLVREHHHHNSGLDC